MPFSTIGRYVPTPVGFARSSKEPLDLYETFKSISNMKDYINTGSVYPGQICKVSDEKTNITLEYLMKRSNTTANKIPGTKPMQIVRRLIAARAASRYETNTSATFFLRAINVNTSIIILLCILKIYIFIMITDFCRFV